MLITFKLGVRLVKCSKCRSLPSVAYPSASDFAVGSASAAKGCHACGVTADDIKVIVFVFPQYHAIPENDRVWFPNFTEWDNVRSTTHNLAGMETLRPVEDWGFYNLLDFNVRKRMGDFVKKYGIYGLAIHHYWFGDHMVMDGMLKNMLSDGEPSVPFFLNWANEPWTNRWNGQDGADVLLAQDYGLEDTWRAHFEAMLPYLRHPKYITVEGRPVLGIYKADHMKDLFTPMMAAFRRWAEQSGFPKGGLEIMHSNWGDVHPDADSIYNFARHSSHPEELTVGLRRKVAVQHKGAMVGWDNSPRHSTRPSGSSYYLASPPRNFFEHLIDLGLAILADPNPKEKENFLFINALNEWGEGNVLEPSKQYGYGHAEAVRDAMRYLRTPAPRLPIHGPDALLPPVPRKIETCFLVRTYVGHADGNIFTLRAMLNSLKALSNPNWEAIVFITDTEEFPNFWKLEIELDDDRFFFFDVPSNAKKRYVAADAGYSITDYVIKHLSVISPAASQANWLVATNGDNYYRTDALDYLDKRFDIIGLNFMSRWNAWNEERERLDIPWDQRCDRLEARPPLADCIASKPSIGGIDLGAMILNFPKFQQAGITFSSFTKSQPLAQDGAMAETLVSAPHSFTFAPVAYSPSDSCQLLHNPSYVTCKGYGRAWIDSPVFAEQRCLDLGEVEAELRKGHYDLEGFRDLGGVCVRYDEETYLKKLKAR
ncbi:hypothetical protein HKX48_000522 [Thoreauomyces humboldtii]|nr:hypothetical protein HKX48_000522 [Thoreauomyces humboldtii]